MSRPRGARQAARQEIRSVTPLAWRRAVARTRRAIRDRRAGIAFADAQAPEGIAMPFEVARYELPIADYPGQEQQGVAKRQNLRVLASALDGSVIAPGRTWSLWRLAGEPTTRRGYGEAAALRGGHLTTEVGGGTCLLSTVVYNAALLSGLAIVERQPHSVDTYGADRYFELGRDATIEFGYIDLRFRNDGTGPARLRVEATDDAVRASVWMAAVPRASCRIEVTRLEAPAGWLRVRTTRRLSPADGEGRDRLDDMGVSTYRGLEAPAVGDQRPGRAGRTGVR